MNNLLLCCYLTVTFSNFWKAQDHLHQVNNVPAELHCVISCVSKTVGLVEALGLRVILLDL